MSASHGSAVATRGYRATILAARRHVQVNRRRDPVDEDDVAIGLLHASVTRQTIVARRLQLEDPVFNRPEIAFLCVQLKKAATVIGALAQTQHNNRMTRGADGGQVARLRRDLRDRLFRISSLAVVTLKGLPGIKEDVRVPHANRKNDDLLEGTDRILKNVRPHLKTLQRAGLRKDEIRKVETIARALKAKAASPDTAIARRSRATSSIPGAPKDGREVVRALERAIRVELAGDSLAQIRWKNASRIPRKLGRPKKRPPGRKPPPQS